MGTEYNGFEFLLNRFKEYQKQTPKGVSLQNKDNKTIVLKFKINGSSKSKGCNCSFTLDGMASALIKARKVAEKLKEDVKLSEFDEWYDREIKDIGKIEDDILTFSEAIKVVEDIFWSSRDRRNQKRIKGHPSHENSWNRTYYEYYKHLPQDKAINLKDILECLKRWNKGTKSFKDAMSAYRSLARKNGYDSIQQELMKINSKQTEFAENQTITLEEFIEWRNKVLGITEKLSGNCKLPVREAWLWVLGIQIVYGLRISEVFAIKNLDKPAYDPDTNKLIVHAYNDLKNNPHRLIWIGRETNIGTTVKSGCRVARPMIPPRHPNLYTDWDLHNPKLPNYKPRKNSSNKTITDFFGHIIRQYLRRWNAPFTQTHADRHLGNLLGMQAGIPQEIRAQSMGHSVTMNESVYKKRQGIQTQIDVLTQSNKRAIDFTSGLLEAKRVMERYPKSEVAIVELLAKIYQKPESEIEELLD